jgi:hypothetical protein
VLPIDHGFQTAKLINTPAMNGGIGREMGPSWAGCLVSSRKSYARASELTHGFRGAQAHSRSQVVVSMV